MVCTCLIAVSSCKINCVFLRERGGEEEEEEEEEGGGGEEEWRDKLCEDGIQ